MINGQNEECMRLDRYDDATSEKLKLDIKMILYYVRSLKRIWNNERTEITKFTELFLSSNSRSQLKFTFKTSQCCDIRLRQKEILEVLWCLFSQWGVSYKLLKYGFWLRYILFSVTIFKRPDLQTYAMGMTRKKLLDACYRLGQDVISVYSILKPIFAYCIP